VTKTPATDSATLTKDAWRLQEAVASLVRVYQYRDRDRICCHDISVTQCHALELLVADGPVRSLVLAKSLMLDKSTTTRVIDALERKGYVERLMDPADARATLLRASASGKRLHQKINADLVRQQEEILENMPEAARAAAIDVIERLALDARRRFVSGVSVGAGSCATDSCTTSPCGT